MNSSRRSNREPSAIIKASRILLALVSMSIGSLALASPPEVVTVPWRGNLDLPHEVFDGRTVHLKGIARGVTGTSTATWNPGDGSEPIPVTVNPDPDGADYDLGVQHTYPDSVPGTPFTAVLEVDFAD